jgi:hypothetical protein
MPIKASHSEIREILHEIKELMHVDEEDLGILSSVIDNDILGISIILQDEGTIRRLSTEMQEIKIRLLKEHSKGDYEFFRQYYKAPAHKWTFLSKDELQVLNKFNKMYKYHVQKYFEDRGDLMVYRKTINSFIASKLKNKESLQDLKEVRQYLMNNYSYYDTLYSLGFNPEIGEDGFVKLNRLVLNEDGTLT